MVQSLQGGREQEKGVVASRLAPQACSFYAGVNAAVGLSDCAGVEVSLGFKDD